MADKIKVTVQLANGTTYAVECDELAFSYTPTEMSLQAVLSGMTPEIEVIRLSLEHGIKVVKVGDAGGGEGVD